MKNFTPRERLPDRSHPSPLSSVFTGYRLKIAFPQSDQAQVGPDQVHVRNAVTLDDGTGRLVQRGVPVQAMTHQG